MQFKIPQFIDIEDKIFGPFTWKQFVYLAGGIGISYILYKALPLFIAFLFITPVAALTFSLAFYQVNRKPFIEVLESAFKYGFTKKLYIWKKREKPIHKTQKEEVDDSGIFVPRLSESKLKDIAWSLDVHDSIYAGQNDTK